MSEQVPTIIVTGGASGIGAAIARLFASRSWAVVIADVNAARAAQVQAELTAAGQTARAFTSDISAEHAVNDLIRSTFEEFGRIDVLCNNAGVETYRRADEYTAQEWDLIQAVNLRGPFLCSRACFAALRQTKGCIINVSSVQAFANEAQISAYASAKAGLLGLTRSTARDFAPFQVRVNAICPGVIRTEMLDDFLHAQSDAVAELNKLTTAVPLQRLGEPEDVAEMTWFLASPAAAYITGASIVVDGGLLARLPF